MLAPIIEEQSLRAAFALVVAGSHPDRIDVTPIVLGLGVYAGVTVDLGGGCLKDLGPYALRQAEHVDGTVYARLGRLHWVVLIMNWRCRARQIIDLIDFDVEWECHVMTDQFEGTVVKQVIEVSPR